MKKRFEIMLKSCVGGDIIRVNISVGRIKSAEEDELWVDSQSSGSCISKKYLGLS